MTYIASVEIETCTDKYIGSAVLRYVAKSMRSDKLEIKLSVGVYWCLGMYTVSDYEVQYWLLGIRLSIGVQMYSIVKYRYREVGY